jgi:hypothetical protein
MDRTPKQVCDGSTSYNFQNKGIKHDCSGERRKVRDSAITGIIGNTLILVIKQNLPCMEHAGS